MSEFDEIVGGPDLSTHEAERLRRVHELLVQAGPPPDLTPALARPAATHDDAEILEFPLHRRRLAVALIAAAALLLAGFGGGFLFGHSKAKPAAFAARRIVLLHGTHNELAVLRLAKRDTAGNWPMEMKVSGLPKQANPAASYVLWLTHDGKPTVPCGWFRVHGKTTTVRFSVPYQVADGDGWAVTAKPAHAAGPGKIVLTA